MKTTYLTVAVLCRIATVAATGGSYASVSTTSYAVRDLGATPRSYPNQQYATSSGSAFDTRPQGRSSSSSSLSPKAQLVSASQTLKNLGRGALLRIGSDLSGGTPLESIKCRVTVTKDSGFQAARNIVKQGGIQALWSGTPSRTLEGALLGAMFILGSTPTKKYLLKKGVTPVIAQVTAGTLGGLAQAIVMTPAGMVFTSLNVNKGKPGYENDNALTVTRRIVKEKGVGGMFVGGGAMALRQASNWASRAGFTEIARGTMSKYGMWGEIGSGAIGGIGSCWNTPIETARVLMHKDVSEGKPAKSFGQYCVNIYEEDGVPGLFRGVTPRGVQAIWQTVFMVVFPTMLGM